MATRLPVLLLALIAPAAANAASLRTFVSGHGSDSNPCSVTLPCRSFQAAVNATAPGGEVDVLDPAGYGAVTIGHAISIQGHGYAGISVAAGLPGIEIEAGAGDRINLRGLLIDGGGVGEDGISWESGGSLNVQDCAIRSVVGAILFYPFGTPAASLFVSNTIIADQHNQGSGITVYSEGVPTVTAVINRVELDGLEQGMQIIGGTSGTVNATISDTVFDNNVYGLVADTHGGTTNVMVRDSAFTDNYEGIVADDGATIRLGYSSILGSQTGWQVSNGGAVESYGDNDIDNNVAGNSAPPATAAPLE